MIIFTLFYPLIMVHSRFMAAPTPTLYASVNNPTIKLSLRHDGKASTDWAPAKTSAGHGNVAATTTKNVTDQQSVS
jgi:hypothetical protein